jgi:hypothetical protein
MIGKPPVLSLCCFLVAMYGGRGGNVPWNLKKNALDFSGVAGSGHNGSEI